MPDFSVGKSALSLVLSLTKKKKLYWNFMMKNKRCENRASLSLQYIWHVSINVSNCTGITALCPETQHKLKIVLFVWDQVPAISFTPWHQRFGSSHVSANEFCHSIACWEILPPNIEGIIIDLTVLAQTKGSQVNTCKLLLKQNSYWLVNPMDILPEDY